VLVDLIYLLDAGSGERLLGSYHIPQSSWLLVITRFPLLNFFIFLHIINLTSSGRNHTMATLGSFAVIEGKPSLDLGMGNAIIGIENGTFGSFCCEFPSATVRCTIPGQDGPINLTGKVTATYKGIEEAAELEGAVNYQNFVSFNSNHGWEIEVVIPGVGSVLKFELSA